jgi:hypothetical protein
VHFFNIVCLVGRGFNPVILDRGIAMVISSTPACRKVDPRFESLPSTLWSGSPKLNSYRDEEKGEVLRTSASHQRELNKRVRQPRGRHFRKRDDFLTGEGGRG